MMRSVLILRPIFSMFLAFDFWILAKNEEVNWTISGEKGTLSSANYPSSYPHNLTTRWTITSSNNGAIQLNFTDFYIEPNKKCLYDYIVISENGGKNSARLCGKKIPPGYRSQGNDLNVVLVSDLTTSFRGFQAVWKSVPSKGSRVTVKSNDKKAKGSKDAHKRMNNCHFNYTVTRNICSSPIQNHVQFSTPVCSCDLPKTVESKQLNAVKPTRTLTVTSLVATKAILPPKSTSSSVAKDVDITSNLAYQKSDVVQGSNRRIAIILGVFVAFFATFNILLLLLLLRQRRRLPSDVVLPSNMFDRVLVKSKRNARRKEKRDRPEQIDDINEYYSDEENSGSETLEANTLF